MTHLERHKKRFRKQPRQSPYGHWEPPKNPMKGDRWVYSPLGFMVGMVLLGEGNAPPSFVAEYQRWVEIWGSKP